MRRKKPVRSPFVVTAAFAVLGCGSRIEGTPSDGGTDGGSDTPSGCPATRPSTGAPCVGTLSCSYNPCGTEVATCRDGAWDVMMGSCNPPPPKCPTAAPVDGDACGPENTGWGGCYYPDPCTKTGSISATCSGTRWSVTPKPLPAAACPPVMPAAGESCAACAGRYGDCAYAAGDCYGTPLSTWAQCDATTKTWRLLPSTCNPPPPMDAGTPAP